MRSPFSGSVSQWLGHKTCWGSAFSDALPKHLFLGFCHVSGVWARSRYQASKSYVAQRFSLFEATWTFREFGHGVAFRHFSGCGFAWLGHDFFVFSGFQKRRFGIFQAAVSQWLGSTKPAGALPFRMRSPSTFFLGFATFREFGPGVVIRPLSLTLRKRFSLFEATWTFREFGHGVSDALPFFRLSFAMAWAQNLLGLCLFGCAPQAPFAWVLPRFGGLGPESLSGL